MTNPELICCALPPYASQHPAFAVFFIKLSLSLLAIATLYGFVVGWFFGKNHGFGAFFGFITMLFCIAASGMWIFAF